MEVLRVVVAADNEMRCSGICGAGESSLPWLLLLVGIGGGGERTKLCCHLLPGRNLASLLGLPPCKL